MSLFTRAKLLAVAAVAAAGLLAGAPARAELSGIFELTWDGPETSTVTESPAEGFDYTYTIRGGLQVDLDPVTPRLINVNSDILLPPCGIPGCPPAISPNLWGNLDLLVGEYVEPVSEGAISLVFAPAELGGVLRGYELFVDITEDGRLLTLTGGIEQDAASPMEPDVSFAVSGRAAYGDLTNSPTPEPASVAMMIAGAACLALIASRRGR
ncbi:MAG: hypothetical protein CMJ58_01040 [Planctomycetaceae bacterium]|nr:hypothetical protein [Planctomycetaceae bacterium]